MWPTFYIPGLARAFDQGTAELDYMCGVVSGVGVFPAPSVATVPTPAAYSDGDIHCVFVTFNTNRTITWPASSSSEWFEVLNTARFPFVNPSQYPVSNQKMFMRTWASGQSNFSASVPSGFINLIYVSVILKNPNLTDPFLSGLISFSSSTAAFASPLGDGSYFSGSRPGDAILFATSSGGLTDNFTPPDPVDVEFVCQNTDGSYGHTVAASYASRGVSNLLKYSRTLDLSAWTMVGLTRTTNVGHGAAKYDVQLNMDTGNTRHYIEQSVSLEAGKTYCFGIAGLGSTPGGAQTSTHLTYVKPDNTEHGVGACCGSITDRGNVAGSEIIWGDDPGPGFIDDNTTQFGVSGHLMYVPIICTASGTYKIRINLTTGLSPFPDPTVAQVGNTACWWAHTDAVLQEAHIANQVPSFYPTEATAVLPGDTRYEHIPFPNCAAGNSGSDKGFLAVVMRRATSLPARPTCHIHAGGVSGRLFDWNSDLTGLSSTYYRYQYGPGYHGMQANHVVYRQLTKKKFYYELTVTNFGTGGAHADYWIGFAPFEAGANSHNIYGTQPYKYAYQYGYGADGTVYNSGTLVGSSYSTWSAGDKIGASIDFENWEIKFYRNGTLVETISITNDARRDALWVGTFMLTGPSVYANGADITVNFKGPFGGRKPSGFYAYDFDNEVA